MKGIIAVAISAALLAACNVCGKTNSRGFARDSFQAQVAV
jgi:predicted small secreted protein